MKRFIYFIPDIVLFIGILLFTYIVITHGNTVFTQLYTVLFLFLVPGTLLYSVFGIHTPSVWQRFFLVVGLSVSFLLFGGLVENFLLQYIFFVSKPLETMPLLYFFDALLGILLVIACFRPKYIAQFAIYSGSFLDILFIILSSLLPLLAVLGAIVLNNGGSNGITMTLLFAIPILLLFLVFFEEHLQEGTYYWYILTASVALLLMLSLRSWHISGWDINDEFRIFQITKTQGFWNPAFGHAYNACLSLTILPTIVSVMTHIPDEYIYKLILQIIFGLTPIIIYALYRNFSTKSVSLLAVFYIIAQPFFIQPMTALIRQEIALFFFSLMTYVLFAKTLNKPLANALFILFGISMVVSHYSTTYITLLLFVGSFILIALFHACTSHMFVKKLLTSFKTLKFDLSLTRNFRAIPLLIVIACTYFWFFQFTQTSGNITSVFMQTIANIKNTFKEKPRSDETTRALSVFTVKNNNSVANISAYADIQASKYQNSKIPIYHPGHVPLYPVQNIVVKSVFSPFITRWANNLFNGMKLITKLIIFLGPFLLLFRYLPQSSDKEFIVLNAVGIAFVVLVIVHPTLGEDYNLSRIYLQILFVAALGGVIFLVTFIPKIQYRIKLLLVGGIFACMFFLFSGVTSQFIGGVAFLQLNNFGDDYDKFYTHTQEVASAQWLAQHGDKKQFIFTDDVSNLRLLSFGNIAYALPVLVPSAMYKNSYVYARYANVVRQRTDGDYSGIHLEYTFPTEFLDTNKNLIYNNGGSRIYR